MIGCLLLRASRCMWDNLRVALKKCAPEFWRQDIDLWREPTHPTLSWAKWVSIIRFGEEKDKVPPLMNLRSRFTKDKGMSLQAVRAYEAKRVWYRVLSRLQAEYRELLFEAPMRIESSFGESTRVDLFWCESQGQWDFSQPLWIENWTDSFSML